MPPYSGFDFEAQKRALERTHLPDKIKCKICKKIRGANAFSKRQLEELRKAILKNGATGLNGPGYAGCRSCISHQTVELTCCVCDKTKPLEYFSKNQRKDPDNARCTNCVQGYLDIEPVMEDSKLLTDDESATDTNTYASHSEAYTANSSSALSVTDDDNLLCDESYDVMSDHTAKLSYHALSQLSIKGKGKEENTSLGGGVWLEQGKRFPEEGAAVKPRQGIPFTAYDPQGNAHLRITAPPSQTGSSTADSSQDTWRHSQSVQVRQASHSPAMVVPKRNSNFVKILGGRVPKEQAPNMYLPEPTGRTVGSDGSSSDDDDDDIQDWI
uniref:Stc1 domain-containing protein n=1 Tax=Coccidioides posadasii RMSCC 3488 TaxID=454284 RepID=A0A0J6FC79_COCPO|nr:hypothetical protein CPAG_06927 [Coccidioides posadasii RMSCC 3488]